MKKARIIMTLVAIAGGLGLTACVMPNEATTSDMCAYTQGTGSGGADAKVHEVYYPGQQFTVNSRENAYWFPCNMRNLRMTEGSTDTWANKQPLGPLTVRTANNTPVKVSASMFWTLNQDKKVIEEVFIPLCNKYNCASSDANLRNANFSTDGWSFGLLGENAAPAFKQAIEDSVRAMNDSVWSDPAKKIELGQGISAAFMKTFHGYTGSTADLFCGSGETSGWTGEVGTSTFRCGNVRIVVDSVVPADSQLLDIQARKAKAEQEKAANVAELDAAKAKYGDNASSVLGDLDRIKACGDAKVSCVFTQGNNGVSVPTTPQK